jgi:hypothetical protein
MFNRAINIPAHSNAHEEHAYFSFWQDATIYALFPHSHYRGRSSMFELIYPDGKQETILSVPNYDFNWQRTYQLVEPIDVPAGTKIVHRTVYDNSEKNNSNPDPTKVIGWGLQSYDEMLYGSMSFSWANETVARPTDNPRTNRLAQLMGYLDQDISGQVTKTELHGELQEYAIKQWRKLDLNQDGGLNFSEFGELMKLAQKQASD